MSWKKGPLPAGTYNWGGVMLCEDLHGRPATTTSGFYFADFVGDHVMVWKGNGSKPKRYEAHEVAFYNNSVMLLTKEEIEQ